MKKRLKHLLNNKGMTLTEMIVAMFLTSVILAIAVGMLAPVKNLMNTMKSNAHMDTINSTVDEYIRGTLQSAKSLKFVVLNDNNTIKDTDTDGVKAFFSANSNVKALAVLDTGVDETTYRLFDFDKIPAGGYTDIVNMLDAKNQELYGVFNEPFYENTSCAVEFYKSGGSRLQVASQCFRDGEMINQKHVLSFNLLNGGVSGFTDIEGDGTETKVDPEEQTMIDGHCYLILYTNLDI